MQYFLEEYLYYVYLNKWKGRKVLY
jgi:hypothetical protein